MALEADGEGTPSVPERILLEVLSVKRGKPEIIRSLSDSTKGLLTHYKARRTIRCIGPTCPKPWHCLPLVWKGFTPVERWDHGTSRWWPAILEITEGLEQAFRGIYKRGQVWQLWREQRGTKKAEPVLGELIEKLNHNQVSPAFPILNSIRLLFHDLDLELNVDNPQPRRVYGYSSFGNPPPFKDASRVEEKIITPEEYQRLREEHEAAKAAREALEKQAV